MTDQDWIDLGRRAVACRGWRWMPGMRYSTDSWRAESAERVPERMETAAFADWLAPGQRIPDLRDPATLGCLLALVREVLGEPLASVEVRQPGDLGCRACVRVPVGSEGWRVLQWWCASQDPHYSEADALVAALENAPEHTR